MRRRVVMALVVERKTVEKEHIASLEVGSGIPGLVRGWWRLRPTRIRHGKALVPWRGFETNGFVYWGICQNDAIWKKNYNKIESWIAVNVNRLSKMVRSWGYFQFHSSLNLYSCGISQQAKSESRYEKSAKLLTMTSLSKDGVNHVHSIYPEEPTSLVVNERKVHGVNIIELNNRKSKTFTVCSSWKCILSATDTSSLFISYGPLPADV